MSDKTSNSDYRIVKASNNIVIQLHLLPDGFSRGCLLVDGVPMESSLFERDKPESYINMLVDHAKIIYKQSI